MRNCDFPSPYGFSFRTGTVRYGVEPAERALSDDAMAMSDDGVVPIGVTTVRVYEYEHLQGEACIISF
eukprot:scaffold505874_cov42-Prasinocladus_malaysianus.AAC.1